MLGKLMKYEWKSTWKLLFPANILIVVMTLFAYITVQLDVFDTDNSGIIFSAIMVIMTYIGSMFVVLIGTAIYLVYRFYISTYGDQGYLLHTLPVDKHHIVIAKVAVSTAWVVISIVLIYSSVIFLFATEGDVFKQFADSMETIVKQAGSGKLTFFALLMTIIAGFVGILARVLKVTACISLGQLSSNHKILMSFAFYFAMYFVQQIVNGFYYAFLGYINMKTDRWYYGRTWEFELISGLIYTVVFYLITWHVMENKLNLD